MIRMTDDTMSVEITMHVWQGTSYSPDVSLEFYEAGSLPYDREHDLHIVDDVDYCIDMARDWGAEDENNAVEVTEIDDKLTWSKDIIDSTVAKLKKDSDEDWESKLYKLCADCGEGSLYQDVLPHDIDDDERDWAIDAIDNYIKVKYGVRV